MQGIEFNVLNRQAAKCIKIKRIDGYAATHVARQFILESLHQGFMVRVCGRSYDHDTIIWGRCFLHGPRTRLVRKTALKEMRLQKRLSEAVKSPYQKKLFGCVCVLFEGEPRAVGCPCEKAPFVSTDAGETCHT